MQVPGAQSQNLISQIREERVLRPSGYWKSAGLDLATIALAICLSYLFRRQIDGSIGYLWIFVVAGGSALASSLATVLTKNSGRRALVVLLQTIALFSFFSLALPSKLLILGILLVYGFFMWGELLARWELNGSLEFRFVRTTRLALNKMVTALIVFWLIVHIPAWNAEDSPLTPEAYKGFYEWTLSGAARIYPDIDFRSTVQGFARSIAQVQLGSDPGFRALLPPAKERMVSTFADQTFATIQGALGENIRPSESLETITYGYLSNLLSGWKKSLGSTFTLVWAVIALGALKGLGFLFTFAISAVGFLVYQLLLAMNLLRIVGESRTKEVLEYW